MPGDCNAFLTHGLKRYLVCTCFLSMACARIEGRLSWFEIYREDTTASKERGWLRLNFGFDLFFFFPMTTLSRQHETLTTRNNKNNNNKKPGIFTVSLALARVCFTWTTTARRLEVLILGLIEFHHTGSRSLQQGPKQTRQRGGWVGWGWG